MMSRARRSWITLLLYVLMWMDALLTIAWLKLDLAIEANVLMAWLIDNTGVLGFALAKCGFSGVFVFTLHEFYDVKHTRARWMCRFGYWLCFVAYSLLIAYHGIGILLHLFL